MSVKTAIRIMVIAAALVLAAFAGARLAAAADCTPVRDVAAVVTQVDTLIPHTVWVAGKGYRAVAISWRSFQAGDKVVIAGCATAAGDVLKVKIGRR